MPILFMQILFKHFIIYYIKLTYIHMFLIYNSSLNILLCCMLFVNILTAV